MLISLVILHRDAKLRMADGWMSENSENGKSENFLQISKLKTKIEI